MKIIDTVQDIINWAAVLIQAPCMFVGGAIIAFLQKDYEPTHKLYVWLPTKGFVAYQCDWLGNISVFEIPYSKLFRKH